MKDTKYWIRLVTGFISVYVIAGIISDWIKGDSGKIIIVPIEVQPDLKDEEIVP